MSNPESPRDEQDVDWSLTTWEGARREQMRRWAELPLERAIMALEEMESLSRNLMDAPPGVVQAREFGANYTRNVTYYDLELTGCAPEPLMSYLKALGILRLVSEQKDSRARGWWKNDVFWLRSSLDRDALVRFFLEEYQPTPIVVPWTGNDFFDVDWESGQTTHTKTPTASKAIEAFLITKTTRFGSYRAALYACKEALKKCGIETKEEMGRKKWLFIQTLRSHCEEPRVIEWIDAAANSNVEKFAYLLGSGGGSDGNTHFSDNFMQNLWDVLPDFNDQREKKKGQAITSVVEASHRQLNDVLYAIACNDKVFKRTSSLYDSGAVGGANATQGMERDSLSNPWNVILALEGTVSFAGAAVKRLSVLSSAAEAVFPFQMSASVTARERLADKELGGKEIWLPLWTRPANSEEVLQLLREGRAQCGESAARSGVDMARAIASLGVDRGISAFRRYAIVKGRVGGDNYNTAAFLGQFDVTERSGVDVLREIDPWLSVFRRACGDKKAPPHFSSALRRIDSAVFEFCKYGGATLFQEIIVALGAAERVLATSERFRQESKIRIRPLADMSEDWSKTADDGSVEFALARGLASVHDREGRIGPIRANLEPIDWRQRCRAWAERDRAVVWNAADLATNMASVLQRRIMDGERAGVRSLPLATRVSVPLESVVAFLGGELDDERIENLIWGLMLVKGEGGRTASRSITDAEVVPRPYALLKLLFLPRPLIVVYGANGEPSVRLLRNQEQGGIPIRPEPSIMQMLCGGRIGEACAIAVRRLRASGLTPMPGPIRGRRVRDDDWIELDGMTASGMDSKRLAAALLIPVSDDSVSKLARLVIRGERVEENRVESVVGTNPLGGILT